MSAEEQACRVPRMDGKRRKKGRDGQRSQSVQGLAGFREDLDPVLSKKECYCGGGS